MKFLALIQNEFLQHLQSDMYKIAKKTSKRNRSTASFLKEEGNRTVKNPSSKRGKNPSIKIKSLKSGDERQKSLFKQLYKQWLGSKSKKVDKKDTKVKAKPKKHIKQIKQELKDKKKEVSKKKPVTKKEVTVEENRPDAEPKKLPEKSDVINEESVAKEQKEEILSDQIEQKLQTENEQKLKSVGDRSNEQYQTTIENVKKNQDQLYRDATNLSDPSPPNSKKLESIQQDNESLTRALKAMKINAEVSDITNSPNVITYKLSLKDLSDEDKVKFTRKLLNRDTKDTISSFVGRNENVTITENRKTKTIDVHVPKGTAIEDRDSVSMKELLTNDKFVRDSKNPTKLPIALGKDEDNNTMTYDFSDTPHLMVAGATKSGKSVFIQSIINSIQMGKSPDECKLVLIDVGKHGGEFQQYSESEYLARPIATTAKEAEEAFAALSSEVDRRSEFLRNMEKISGGRFKNIEQWNGFITKDPEKMNDDEKNIFELIPADQRKKMNRIVTIVDESMDLFSPDQNANAKKLEADTAHLLTIARAAGIHIVLATQSPSKSSLPSKIQKNIGAKMCLRLQMENDAKDFKVPDATDLLMYGDGYFVDPATTGTKPTRLQTGFISEKDDAKINSVTKGEQKFIEREKKPEQTAVTRFKATDDPVYIEFQKQMAGVREKLTAQRERLEGRSKELDSNIDKIRAQREELQTRREERQKQLEKTRSDQTDIKRQKERTPSDIDTVEQPEETDIDQLLAQTSKGPEAETKSEPDISDDNAVKNEIDEMTKPEPVKEPVKSNDPFLTKIREDAAKKKLEPEKKSMLDRIKKLLGKKSTV